ncbi:unnamed protein product [Calypogeia fissa]
MPPIHAYVYFCLVGIIVLLSCWTSVEVQARTQRTLSQPVTIVLDAAPSSTILKLDPTGDGPEDPCDGRRIFMYDLPPEFNTELIGKCRYGLTNWLNFCPHAQNGGLGQHYLAGPFPRGSNHSGAPFPLAAPSLPPSLRSEQNHPSWFMSDSEGLGSGWYKTDPYMLELVFHARMQKYSCLTTDSSRADALYLPYYTGVDALRYLYNSSVLKYSHGERLAEWIKENAQREWERFGGKDHFLVLARTSWDFYLLGNGSHTLWGTGLFQNVPHMRNLTALIMERKPWMKHEQAIPYLTSFHPSESELRDWLVRVRNADRSSLFSFAGASRSNIPRSIRNYLLDQCSNSPNCTLINCSVLKCSHNPEPIMKTFLHSSFCLQPRGDTPTRRSAFDSMIAGCIPVFFHKDSAYSQYSWHLPEDPTSYSVFVSEQEVRDGLVVEDVLKSMSSEKVQRMREAIVSIIPKLVYARENGEFVDAFEISLQNVLSRVTEMKRKLLKKNYS